MAKLLYTTSSKSFLKNHAEHEILKKVGRYGKEYQTITRLSLKIDLPSYDECALRKKISLQKCKKLKEDYYFTLNFHHSNHFMIYKCSICSATYCLKYIYLKPVFFLHKHLKCTTKTIYIKLLSLIID